MTQATKVRAPLAPATGTAAWAGVMPNGNRLLRITSQTKAGEVSELYEVACAGNGWDLYKVDTSGKVYHIRHYHGKHYSCDCPDASNRPSRKCACKHSLGLLAAIDADPF